MILAPAGGHDVPTEKLAARHARLWPLVVAARPACYRAVLYDNAIDQGPVEVAAFRFGVPDYAPRWPAWTPAALLDPTA